jgi:mannose-6-phosphate isomerase-like protein (cupin superfamily)
MSGKKAPEKWRITFDETAKLLEGKRGPDGKPFEVVLNHGTMRVGLYAPRGTDPQQPHLQDEIYVVMRGTGRFICGDEQQEFGPGDVIFVPAGLEHRFIDFTDDFYVWVTFYGQDGGESE